MATCVIFRASVAAALVLLASPLLAAEPFSVGLADDYTAKQSQAGVTLAVKPYHTEELQKEAFGKGEPNRYGILPVLVVITNGGDSAIKLDGMYARYAHTRSREDVESLTAEDLFFYNPRGHAPTKSRLPGLGNSRTKVKKGPLANQVFSDREFSAPVLPPGATASGFFYFNVGVGGNVLKGASIYVSGLKNMSTGQDLFFFEVPLSVGN